MREHLKSLLVCVAAAAVGATALTGCAKKVEQPEPAPEIGPVPLNQFVRGWAQDLELAAGDSIKEIHPREDKVFFYTNSGQVMAMSADAGRLLWATQLRQTARGGLRPPVILKDRVVVPTSSTLEILEPNEGRLLRSVPLKVAARSDAVGTGDLVFLGGDFEGAGRVVALDISKQYVPTVWQLMIPKGGLASTPALHDEVLYIGGGDGAVYAVAAATRDALWSLKDSRFQTEGPIVGDVAADETGVYVASTDTRMYCLNRGSGRLKWQYYGGTALREGPILTASHVYLPIPNAGIAAFSKAEGEFNRKPIWLAAGMTQFLAEDDKLVYLKRGGDNVIVAVDKATGEQRFESRRRDLTAFATNRKPDGTIYAASKGNRVMAIKPVLRPGVVGELVWDDQPAAGPATPQAVALGK